MSEKIKVRLSPVQRNKFDVAIELTQIYASQYTITEGELERLFAKFYALADYCETMSDKELRKFLSRDILNARDTGTGKDEQKSKETANESNDESPVTI